tara:strand:+ start:1844 stop:2509 length:666 start_codon:yes stop_codon:yes gene_type:complete
MLISRIKKVIFKFIYVFENPKTKMFIDIINLRLRLTKEMDISFGDYLEFGVYNGSSTKQFYRALKINKIKNKKFFLFDTFTGLPVPKKKDKYKFWLKGTFKFSLSQLKNDLANLGLKNVKFIKGEYSKSLKNLKLKINPGIIVMDCDYFSSTKSALNYLKKHLTEGTIIYFDDINTFYRNPNKGMYSAILNFNKNNNNIGLVKCPWFSGKYNDQIYICWKN